MEEKIVISDQCLSRDEILRYKLGKISSDELRRIEVHIIDCPLCSMAIDEVEETNEKEMRIDFEKVKINIDSKVKKNLHWRAIISSVAAILIIGFVALFNLGSQPINEKLFSEFYEIYPDITLHKRNSNSVNKFNYAMDKYNLEKYNDAIVELNSIPIEERNDTVNFYTGITYLALNDFKNSITVLKKLANKTNSSFYYDTQWYIALANIYLENYDEAKKKLLIISASNSKDYKNKANKLFIKIKDLQ